jgi:hypothetical protein
VALEVYRDRRGEAVALLDERPIFDAFAALIGLTVPELQGDDLMAATIVAHVTRVALIGGGRDWEVVRRWSRELPPEVTDDQMVDALEAVRFALWSMHHQGKKEKVDFLRQLASSLGKKLGRSPWTHQGKRPDRGAAQRIVSVYQLCLRLGHVDPRFNALDPALVEETLRRVKPDAKATRGANVRDIRDIEDVHAAALLALSVGALGMTRKAGEASDAAVLRRGVRSFHKALKAAGRH